MWDSPKVCLFCIHHTPYLIQILLHTNRVIFLISVEVVEISQAKNVKLVYSLVPVYTSQICFAILSLNIDLF